MWNICCLTNLPGLFYELFFRRIDLPKTYSKWYWVSLNPQCPKKPFQNWFTTSVLSIEVQEKANSLQANNWNSRSRYRRPVAGVMFLFSSGYRFSYPVVVADGVCFFQNPRSGNPVQSSFITEKTFVDDNDNRGLRMDWQFYRSHWQSVLLLSLAFSSVVVIILRLQLLRPLQFDFRWYLVALGLSQMYTVVVVHFVVLNSIHASKSDFIWRRGLGVVYQM